MSNGWGKSIALGIEASQTDTAMLGCNFTGKSHEMIDMRKENNGIRKVLTIR